MNIENHNPDYKLISVVINKREFVYGETNGGGNPGLEIYYLNGSERKDGHYYSRRYKADNIPGIYSFLYRRLKALVPYCPAGNCLSMDNAEYSIIAQLQGRYTNYKAS